MTLAKPLRLIPLCTLLLAGCSGPGNAPEGAVPPDVAAPRTVTPAPPPPPIDIVGLWQPSGADDTLQGVGDKPVFTAAGRKLFDTHRKAAARGDRSWDGTRRCLPPGTPRVMTIAQPFDIHVDGHLMALTFQYQGLVRFIYMDDAYPTAAAASYLGDSHGHWDGLDLVVETKNFRPDTVLDHTGLPHGSRLVVTERFERMADDTLVDHITISDPEMYLKPWQAAVTLKRRADLHVQEDVCAERNDLLP